MRNYDGRWFFGKLDAKNYLATFCMQPVKVRKTDEEKRESVAAQAVVVKGVFFASSRQSSSGFYFAQEIRRKRSWPKAKAVNLYPFRVL
jgi:hypothetical protein